MTPPAPIYLDANASTPMRPEVLEAFVEAARSHCANPASDHLPGRAARTAIETARQEVAELISAQPFEVVFTSGATESLALALRGLVASDSRPWIALCSRLEHAAVLETLADLERAGKLERRFVPTDAVGRVDPGAILEHAGAGPTVACFFHGNNEIGTLNDVAALADAAALVGARLVVDAAQTGGYETPDLHHVDFLCLSAHKMHGPKGVGALFVKGGGGLHPLLCGGGQERGLRAGTPNVPGIVAFGVAARLARVERGQRSVQVHALRARFLEILVAHRLPFRINGDLDRRLPGNLSLTFPGVEGVALRRLLPHLSISTASACASGSGRPSHVLQGIGLSEVDCECTIRLGFSSMNTQEEVERAASDLVEAARCLMRR